MGAVDRIWKAIWSPATNEGQNTITTGQGLDAWLRLGASGSTIAGVSVNEDNVLQIADVWKVVRVLSEDVGKLPLDLMRREGKNSSPAIDHPSFKMLHTQPNPFQTKLEFWESMMAHALTRGNAYALMNRTRLGITEMLPVEPQRVKVKRMRDQSRQYTIARTDENGGLLDPIVTDQREVFHLPGLSLNGVVGLSLVALLRETLGGNKATVQHGSAFFGNGAKPNAVYQMDGRLSDPSYERLKAELNTDYTGTSAYRTLLLEEGLKFQQTSMSQEDAQFIDTRKMNRSDVAGIWRVPLHKIMDLDKATFSNIEQMDRQYITDSLLGWLIRIEQRLHMQVLNGDPQLYLKHAVEGMLRGNSKDRAQFYHFAILDGWLNRNEVRATEDLNPGPPELDKYLEPENMRNPGDATGDNQQGNDPPPNEGAQE